MVPVALTNTPSTVTPKPSSAKRPRSGPKRPSCGAQVISQHEQAEHAHQQRLRQTDEQLGADAGASHATDGEWQDGSRAAPMRACEYIRDRPPPSWIRVCIGISTAGG